jgi:transcriptional regulator with XRE-family HTH domain
MALEDSFVADKIIDLELSDKIRAYRTSKNFSQKEVALSIGIDQAQYSRIESGKVER